MFKINNKDTKTLTFIVNFEHISHLCLSVSIVNFEQVNVDCFPGFPFTKSKTKQILVQLKSIFFLSLSIFYKVVCKIYQKT